MKTKTRIRIIKGVLLALGALLAAAVGFCIVPVTSFLSARSAYEGASYEVSSDVTGTEMDAVTDEVFQQLLSGETTLDAVFETLSGEQATAASSEIFLEVESGSASSKATVAEASSETSADSDTDSAEDASPSSAVNETTAESEASESATSSSEATEASSGSASSGETASSSTAASSESAEADYEKQTKALLQELYALRASAQSTLNSCIASAKAEYKALPADQRTQAKKVSIAFSKAGQLYSLQATCDQEVNRIVSEMREILIANGQSTALADSAKSSYQQQKSAMYSSLMSQLYS